MVAADDKPLTKRAKRREKRTREIVDAAMQIVAEGGIDALTMPRLAEEAGAAVGALYRYFAGKDALMVALQVQALEVFIEYMDERLEAWSPGPLDARVAALAQVLVVAQGWTHFATVNPPVFSLLDGWVSDLRHLLSDEAAAEVEAAAEPAFARLALAFGAAVQAGALKPGSAMLRTMVLWAGLHGLSHMTKRDRVRPSELDTKKLVQEFLGASLVGWGALPEEAQAAVQAAAGFRLP